MNAISSAYSPRFCAFGATDMSAIAGAKGPGPNAVPWFRLRMARREVKEAEYQVWYESKAETVHFKGALRLPVKGYTPLSELLDDVLKNTKSLLILEFSELGYLNSSGINAVFRFIIALRKRGDIRLIIRGKKSISWQGKALKSAGRFYPGVELQLR